MRAPLTPKAVAFALFTLAAGCDAPQAGTWLVGDSLIDTRLVLTTLEQGIHPSADVLDNPNNPFRYSPPGPETRWTILEYGGDAAAFYAWATLLAVEPSGERQFYAATFLKAIYDRAEVTPVELPFVKDMAIRAFQSQLDNFPEAVTFDASGTIPYELATPAYKAMLALGAVPRGWVLVNKPDGGEIAVPGGPNVIPASAEVP
jgi:hypothetical protein